MSYATPEGRIVRKLLDYCATLPHCVAHKVHGNTYSAGEPDLDIVCNGRAVKVEVKTPGTEAAIRKRVTPLQRAMLLDYQRAGAIAGVVTNVDELRALLFDATLLDGAAVLDVDLDKLLATAKLVREACVMGMAVRVVTPRERGRGCLGKVPYRTLDAAQLALLRVVDRFARGIEHDTQPDRPMSVYSCETCACWHIGHMPADVRDRR